MVLSLLPSHYSSLLDTPFDRVLAADPFVLSVFGPDLSHHDRADPRRRCAPRSDKHSASQPETTVLASSFTSHNTHDATVVTVDLPGVPKHHVTVEVDGRKLTVSGRRRGNVDTSAPESAGSTDVAMDANPATDAKATDANATDANATDANATVEPSAAADQTDHTPPAHKHNHAPAHDVVYKTVIRLSPTIDADAIVAERMQDGVLTLRLPHRKHPEPRRLSIQ